MMLEQISPTNVELYTKQAVDSISISSVKKLDFAYHYLAIKMKVLNNSHREGMIGCASNLRGQGFRKYLGNCTLEVALKWNYCQ